MPRRKKLPDLPEKPDLTGLGRPDKDPMNWVIQKSSPLLSLSKTDLTLIHFRILDAYLARIDSHNPDERYIEFQKGELEHLLGLKRINRDDLEKQLKGLFCPVRIEDKRKPNGFTIIGLFEKATCEQDEDGLWQVRLACTASAMEYIFNIENIGYIRYVLHNIINLSSRYSYILFLMLQARYNSAMSNTWEIPLSDLKAYLNCTASSYANGFKEFNKRILKKCSEEINEKTDIKFSYRPITAVGRKVNAVEFSISSSKVSNIASVDPNQISFDDLKTDGFTAEEMELLNILTEGVPDKEQYLKQKLVELAIAERNAIANGKPIKKRFDYLKKMIKNDDTKFKQKTSDIQSAPSFDLEALFEHAKNTTPTLKK